MKIKFENIMRVGDLHYTLVSNETLDYLKEHGELTYRDTIMQEHIYNIGGTLEDDDALNETSEEVIAELGKINKALNKNECGYLRIVYS